MVLPARRPRDGSSTHPLSKPPGSPEKHASWETASSRTKIWAGSSQVDLVKEVSTHSSRDGAGRASPRRRTWASWWYKEILAIVATFSFQGAAVAILIHMSEQPLSAWNFLIGLNATISIFSTATKATLLLAVNACISQWKWLHFKGKKRPVADLDLFDDASRGSLGSLLFLAHFRWNMGAVGSLITIVVLAFEPFTQQVIVLKTRNQPQFNSSAAFAFSPDYLTDTQESAFYTVEGGIMKPQVATSDVTMQAAIYRGLYNLPPSQLFNCSSACTWEGSFMTLGFQNSCSNVTEATSSSRNCTEVVGNGGFNCTMQTPGGVTLSTVYNPTDFQTLAVINSTTLLEPNALTMISQLAFFRVPSTFNIPTANYIGEEIVECTISVVGYRYSNVTANGNTLNMDPTETVPLQVVSYNTTDFGAIVFKDNSTGQLYRTRSLELSSISIFFNSGLFSGEMLGGDGDSGVPLGMTGAFLAGNITDLVGQMTSSMTDRVRSGDNRQLAQGTAEEQVIFVRVQWEWLSLPIVAEVATLILLVVTMWSSRRTKEVGLWKSSNMALLYHSVSERDGILHCHVRDPDELQKIGDIVKAGYP